MRTKTIRAMTLLVTTSLLALSGCETPTVATAAPGSVSPITGSVGGHVAASAAMPATPGSAGRAPGMPPPRTALPRTGMPLSAAATPAPGARPVPPIGPDPRGGVFELSEAVAGLTPKKGRLVADIETTKGAISCELWETLAPNTVANFVGLARGIREFADPATGEWTKRPYFDGLAFHRVIPGFMVQWGDPYTIGWSDGKPGFERVGTGNPGYKFDDEIHAKNHFDRPGLLAMANAGVRLGKGTNGSQMFLTINSDLSRLDAKHTIFGECSALEVINAIATTPRHMYGPARDRPIEPVVINKVTISRK